MFGSATKTDHTNKSFSSSSGSPMHSGSGFGSSGMSGYHETPDTQQQLRNQEEAAAPDQPAAVTPVGPTPQVPLKGF